jgi:hypothetical protein
LIVTFSAIESDSHLGNSEGLAHTSGALENGDLTSVIDDLQGGVRSDLFRAGVEVNRDKGAVFRDI